jgi:hypothetical protein
VLPGNRTKLNNVYYILAHRHTLVHFNPKTDNFDASHRFEGAVSSPTSEKEKAEMLLS